MKIGIFQDVHGNLPALNMAIDVFHENRCDQIIHVGDLIGIGPYPKECLETCLTMKHLTCVMGNHDYWYVSGLPVTKPNWMSPEEFAHQLWTHSEIGPAYKGVVSEWKFMHTLMINEKKITFLHYALNETRNGFKPILKNPTRLALDNLFGPMTADIIFYGHQHIPNDSKGRCRYVNLGCAGCHNKPAVRLGILEIYQGQLKLKKMEVPYYDDGLMDAFELKKVPARAFIKKTFITRESNP